MKNASAATIDALIAKAKTGDREAFCQVVEQCHAGLRFFLAARAPDFDLAEEALQAGLVAAWERLADYRQEGTFVAWVRGICLNRLREELRRRRQRSMVGLDVAWLVACEDACSTPTDEDGRLERLRHCLAQLGDGPRALLDQRYGQGMSLQELARRVRRPAGTLAVTLHRLRVALLACLEGAHER